MFPCFAGAAHCLCFNHIATCIHCYFHGDGALVAAVGASPVVARVAHQSRADGAVAIDVAHIRAAGWRPLSGTFAGARAERVFHFFVGFGFLCCSALAPLVGGFGVRFSVRLRCTAWLRVVAFFHLHR